MSPETFGSLLRQARLARGWTQQDLAQRVGISREHVANLERDRRRPALPLFIALVRELQPSALDLQRWLALLDRR